MSVRSPSGVSSFATASTDFGTGVLSPVSADSSISSAAEPISRPSAGTRSPASSETTSPGTRSPESTSDIRPPRVTLALTISIFSSAATLASALPSWFRPRAALNRVRTISRMPVASWSGRNRLKPPATSRTICIGSRYCRRKARHFGSALPAVSLLGPKRDSLAAASASVSPRAGSTLWAWSAWWVVRVCQVGAVPADAPSVRAAVSMVQFHSQKGVAGTHWRAKPRWIVDSRRPRIAPVFVYGWRPPSERGAASRWQDPHLDGRSQLPRVAPERQCGLRERAGSGAPPQRGERAPVDGDGKPRPEQPKCLRRSQRVHVARPDRPAPAPHGQERQVEPGAQVRHAGEHVGVAGEVDEPPARDHVAQRAGTPAPARPRVEWSEPRSRVVRMRGPDDDRPDQIGR